MSARSPNCIKPAEIINPTQLCLEAGVRFCPDLLILADMDCIIVKHFHCAHLYPREIFQKSYGLFRRNVANVGFAAMSILD